METPKQSRVQDTTLGEKILLDRYALKDSTKRSLAVGDLVVACVDTKSGQREVGTAHGIADDTVQVELRGGDRVEIPLAHVDKPIETDAGQVRARVARGLAAVEAPAVRDQWEQRFRWLLDEWRFVPGGRILAAAGTDQDLTYYNCYVIPGPHDSRQGIVDTLARMMEIMSRGGGVGINISSLRPRHSYVRGVNGRSSGAVSWGALYSFVTGLIEQGGSRRGALMLICDVWHPDLLEFISAKRQMGKITNANVSVGVTDDFMTAVRADAHWDLVFPDTSDPDYDAGWDGDLAAWQARGKGVTVHRRMRAREIWDTIIDSAWASAEPGVWFKERANRMSNSWYYAPLVCTNPCGEQPLPGWSVCNLGALNLARFVSDGEIQWQELGTAVRAAVRFLDNVVDATPYFFAENRAQQLAERRVGLGTMGLAEALIRLRVRYGSPESVAVLDRLYAFIAREAYLASAELAAEKGPFPRFDVDRYLESGFMRQMPQEVRAAVREQGARNVTILTQAPTGTTGTMVGTSTGIEPYFAWAYTRTSRLGIHEERVGVVEDWRQRHPGQPLPDYFVTAMDLTPEEHVRVQAAIQRWVDSSISKTCNVPADYTVEQTRELYELMYELGCKGGTIYRDRSRDQQVLDTLPDASPAAEGAGRVRPLPPRRLGVTVSKPSPVGTAHITMNDDEQGSPLEVFVEIGRGGSDLKVMAEALGRLMSLVLRMVSALTPVERIAQIVGQLKGIGGSRSYGYGAQRVRSLPDAVAQALEQNYLEPSGGADGSAAEAHSDRTQTDLAHNGAAVASDICPSCGEAALLHQEGCSSCRNCGYSEC